MGGFAAGTAVAARGAGRYSACIRPGWDIEGNTNGGYLLAIAARAMAAVAARPDPVSITAHYLAPGRAGEVALEARVLKRGRRFGVVSASMSAADKPLLAVLGSFGELGSEAAAVERVDAAPPGLPPLEHCVAHASLPGSPPFDHRVDLRLHPEDAGFARGQPSGMPRVRGWFRLAEDEPIDTIGLLLAVDAFPPTVFNAHLPRAWTPTLELTVHVRARPAPGWLRASFSTRFVSGGFLEEDGEIWDSTGRMVAQSRQLALMPRR